MERKTRRIVTGLAATGLLAGALAGGGVMLTGSATAAPANVADVAASSASAARAAAPDRDGFRFLRREARGALLVLRTSASYLGLKPAELRARLHSGQSLSAIAVAQGKSASGLESAIMGAVTKRVDASHLSAARKTALIGRVQKNLSWFVSASHPFEQALRRLDRGRDGAARPAPAASSPSTAAAA